MKFKTNLLPIIALLVIGACATLTPKQKVLWALDVYYAQYISYLDMVINPALSESEKAYLKDHPESITPDKTNPKLTADQRKILNVKRDILVELKPLVLMSAEYQKSGRLPSDDVQRQLTELINKLVELSEK